MLVKHVSERPRPIRERRPDIPAYLAVAIDRALAKRPEDRWVDAAEFRDALDAAQKSSLEPAVFAVAAATATSRVAAGSFADSFATASRAVSRAAGRSRAASYVTGTRRSGGWRWPSDRWRSPVEP